MLWALEVQAITAAADRRGLDARFLMAIRRQEHGAPGRDFGVLSLHAPTYMDQLTAAARTLTHRLAHYPANPWAIISIDPTTERLIYSYDFIAHFARSWAPVGAANDTHQLNRYWPTNVQQLYTDLHLIDPRDNHWTRGWL